MQNNQMIMALGMWVLIFVIFYLLLVRPQKKKEKKLTEMRNSLEKGDTVVTVGGIIAKVSKVEEEKVILELGPNRTKVPFERWAIGRIIEKTQTKEIIEVEEKMD
ncbi:preprotein translocase subunit YajC [Peptostreptococcus equinus]|uniref:Preprotein translocase subunit YajC n=1 Tax=Peptostreptococcus equinus TaxID=3003601 RepID=A0ABY7JSQ1_9FIRM|nr:preprotein translocase subunit YajC [Peptostreptococcus sp. CBA3647]WAW15496.1 preprotein translocase subunit YajC [Peptostreptococcus sp. CBA3647]